MKAIVAVDKNWGIGYKGELLKRVPEDMKFFKQSTIGKVVVMGRTTFESLPGREPLKGRTNMVLSRNKDFDHPGVIVCRSLKELEEKLIPYEADDINIIGGAQIYTQLLPCCSEAIVTRFEDGFNADAFFPNLEKDKRWTSVMLSEGLEYKDMQYSRIKYMNKSKCCRLAGLDEIQHRGCYR